MPLATAKFTAFFLIAFVCLNAGGASCLAYCAVPETAETEHCPLKKLSDHCDKVGSGEDLAASLADGKSLDCCSLAVSFFAAPLEKNQNQFGGTEVPAASQIAFVPPGEVCEPQNVIPAAYRGPPLDRRPDRIKQGILRI